MHVRVLGHLSVTIAGTVLLFVSGVGAETPEQQCQKGRYDAAAKYLQCELKVVGKYAACLGDCPFAFPMMAALSKCRSKYSMTWPKLQAKATGSGSSCDQARFSVGGGTVTDNLTGLQWEQKTDDGSVHDKDNLYKWSEFGDPEPTDANGDVFTSFLGTLNSSCFAGQCDWRLPTRSELQTILLASDYPCPTSPCIDEGVFGPTAANVHWSSTPEPNVPEAAWGVLFSDGFVNDFFKYYQASSARAVRGGL